jgi:hypothetical protein
MSVWDLWKCFADSIPRAVPVDIIKLLSHVDAFESAQPDARTLRLCNRFGKGKNAYVAKLPKEIIDMIERQLLVQYSNTSATQRAVDWPVKALDGYPWMLVTSTSMDPWIYPWISSGSMNVLACISGSGGGVGG